MTGSAHEICSSLMCACRLHVVGGLSSVTSSGHAVVLLGAEVVGVANRDSSSLVAPDATCGGSVTSSAIATAEDALVPCTCPSDIGEAQHTRGSCVEFVWLLCEM